jgi:uncharacterized membrane protein
MKVLIGFLKSTLVGGFFVVLPLLLLYLLLDEVLEAVVGLAIPIIDLFPEGTFETARAPVIVAVALLVLASSAFGLAARLPVARRFGNWLERNTIGRLPLYRVVKSLTSRFTTMGNDGRFRPALVRGPNGQREFGYLMEDLDDGFAVVMLPRAPTPMSGSIRLVPVADVEELDVSLADLTAVISHWGLGSKALMDRAG